MKEDLTLEQLKERIETLEKQFVEKDKYHDEELAKFRSFAVKQQKKLSASLSLSIISIVLYVYVGNTSIPETTRQQIDNLLILLISGGGAVAATAFNSDIKDEP